MAKDDKDQAKRRQRLEHQIEEAQKRVDHLARESQRQQQRLDLLGRQSGEASTDLEAAKKALADFDSGQSGGTSPPAAGGTQSPAVTGQPPAPQQTAMAPTQARPPDLTDWSQWAQERPGTMSGGDEGEEA